MARLLRNEIFAQSVRMNRSGHRDMGGAEPLDKGKIRFKDRAYGAEEMARCIRDVDLQARGPKFESQHSHEKLGMAANESALSRPQTCSNSSYFPDLRRPGSLEGDDQVAHNTFSDLNLVT